MRISRKSHKPDNTQKRYFSNEAIKFPQLRVIGADGENLGVLNSRDALQKAIELDLDLVLINPKAEPPVAKIVNFGQFKYQKEKEDRIKKAQSHVTEVKGVRLTPRIAQHDMETRVRQSIGFLERGDKVQVEVLLKGRDKAHPEIVEAVVRSFIAKVKETVELRIDQDVQRQGNKFTAIFAKA